MKKRIRSDEFPLLSSKVNYRDEKVAKILFFSMWDGMHPCMPKILGTYSNIRPRSASSRDRNRPA
jgi:hypothetical protein